jgi:hypothetical protein
MGDSEKTLPGRERRNNSLLGFGVSEEAVLSRKFELSKTENLEFEI